MASAAWVELHVTEVDALTRMRLLKEETRNDPNEVREALYGFLDQTLVQCGDV